MELPSTGHDPVLLAEVLHYLAPRAGQTIIDCTLGRGGHALAIAQQLGPDGLLIGVDVDPQNLEFAKDRLASTGRAPTLTLPRSTGGGDKTGTRTKDEAAPCRVRLFHANFAELEDVLAEVGLESVDGFLADLGVSTNQLFEPQYGLSFTDPMPLDMRLDPRLRRSAADIVNHTRENDLADILFDLAQERYSRRIARKIVEARRISPITTTQRLADIVRAAVPSRGGAPEKIDPATRTFLALRMYVNQEMENLERLLESGLRRLSPGGRMAVISFQSMEDRLVKQAFRSAEQAGRVRILTSKPVIPSPAELQRNPRSRSSKLRAIEAVGR